MSLILLGVLNAQAVSGTNYWMALLAGGGAPSYDPAPVYTQDRGRTINADSSNNVLLTGIAQLSSGTDQAVYFGKLDSAGAVSFEKTLNGSSYADQGRTVKQLANGNYFVGGTTRPSDVDNLVVEYDSSGTIVRQRRIAETNTNVQTYSFDTDSNNDAYMVGGSNLGSTSALKVDFINSAIDWQKINSKAKTFYGVAVDANDDAYFYGYGEYDGALGGRDGPMVMKMLNNGTLSWQRIITDWDGSYDGNFNGTWNDGVIDSAGNLCVIARSTKPAVGADDIVVAKYLSNGTLSWLKQFTSTGDDEGWSIAVDSEDNIYIAGQGYDTTNSVACPWFAKLNSSGTIQWQRQIRQANAFYCQIAVDSNDDLLINVRYLSSAGSNSVFVWKLPNDGSLTNTYSFDSRSFIYEAASLSAADVTGYQNRTAAGTLSDDGFSISTPTLTAGTRSSNYSYLAI